MVNASQGLVWSFVGLALVLASAFVAAVYRSAAASANSGRHALIAATATIAWLGLTFALAAAGALSFSTRPPTMFFLVPAIIGLAVAIGLSPLGRRLAMGVPLAALVGIQGFRF